MSVRPQIVLITTSLGRSRILHIMGTADERGSRREFQASTFSGPCLTMLVSDFKHDPLCFLFFHALEQFEALTSLRL